MEKERTEQGSRAAARDGQINEHMRKSDAVVVMAIYRTPFALHLISLLLHFTALHLTLSVVQKCKSAVD